MTGPTPEEFDEFLMVGSKHLERTRIMVHCEECHGATILVGGKEFAECGHIPFAIKNIRADFKEVDQ